MGDVKNILFKSPVMTKGICFLNELRRLLRCAQNLDVMIYSPIDRLSTLAMIRNSTKGLSPRRFRLSAGLFLMLKKCVPLL